MEREARVLSLLESIASDVSDTVAVPGFESITVTNAHAESLTVPATATKAIITIEGNSVRIRYDGMAPTTSVGHLHEIGDVIELSGHDLTHFKAIAIGSDAVLSVTYSTEV